jgi:glycosyltransferase involved in cell wall biosynthesis
LKISIAVPSYNYGKYIYDCLKSIKDQNYNNYEVLISDGGSTDNSLAIINGFCESDKRFTLVSYSDTGQADAIMKAFSHASGDIFCFLNSDDVFLGVDVFSAVASAFLNYKVADIICFEGYYIDMKGNYIKKVRLRYHPLDSTSNMKYRTAVLQPATFWRKKVYKNIPIDTDRHYVFDAVFFYQAYMNYSWLDLTKPVAGHRLHGLNKSLQISATRINEISDFERLKFGAFSYRVYFIKIVSWLIKIANKIPFVGKIISKLIYYLVNSLSFITFYKMPSI